MTFELPKLFYPIDALVPHIPGETLEFQDGKHHATYVKHLNDLVKGTRFEHSTVEEIMKSAGPGALFNNAAQHFNHSFYWTSLKPKGGGEPGGELGYSIKKSLWQFCEFQKEVQRSSDDPFWQRVGVANSECGWIRRGRVEARRRQPDRPWQNTPADLRCMGARILHRLPQRARKVRRGVLEYRQLEFCELQL
jgi:iron/manganese superoxide dismutase-like protein